MSPAVATALHMVGNVLLPFVVALGLMLLTVRIFRMPESRWKLALLLLPFVKLGAELAKGVPTDAFMWAEAQGVVRHGGFITVGLGVRPTAGIQLTAASSAVVNGQHYSLGAGDLLVSACQHVGFWCGPALLAVLLGLGGAALARRLASRIRFERQVRLARSAALSLGTVRLGWRTVDVYLSDGPAACPVPFAGGSVRPYVCFPRAAFDALSPAERRAVLEHELGHLRHHDPLLLDLLGAIGCALWFVPGCRWLAARIAAACERLADDAAIAHGAEPRDLAAAMVQVGQLALAARLRPLPSGVGGLTASRNELAARVRRLLGTVGQGRPRLGWRWLPVRVVAFAVVAQTVLAAVAFTNH